MTQLIEDEQWRMVRASTVAATERFIALVTRAPDPDLRVTPHWSVTDTLVHLAGIARLDRSLVGAAGPPPILPDLPARLAATTVDTVAELNEAILRHTRQRRVPLLAARLRADVEVLLLSTEKWRPTQTVRWLGNFRVPVAGLLAHLTNELLVHGRDIARKLAVPWTVSPGEAALFFELFIIGTVRTDYGCLFDTSRQPPERRIAVRFRSAYTRPVTLVLDRGAVCVGAPGADVDADVFFDPVAFDLVLFGRVSRLWGVLTRKLVVGGRRPWLLPAFLRVIRMPSGGVRRRPQSGR